MNEHIEKNLSIVREKIDKAAASRDKRYSGKVRLLAVTKTVPAEQINFAISRGVDLIGENKANELLEKYDKIDKDGLEIHFIGNLQANKVRHIIDKVHMIQSVNSIRLAEEIDKRAAQHGISMNILTEINIGGEESKTGIDPKEALEFAQSLKDFKNLRVSGLMTMAPPPEKLEKPELLRLFEKIYEIFIDISSKKIDNVDMQILSAGMSEDFEEAISRGANLVRIGRAIFGER